ncbi:MAG: outer membrane beta-barrel protein [Thermoguttaceae bacterium]
MSCRNIFSRTPVLILTLILACSVNVLALTYSYNDALYDEIVLGQSCTQKSCWDKISMYGWMQAGFQANQYGAGNVYTTPDHAAPASRNQAPNSGNSYLLMTNQQTDLKLNQLWLGMVKPLDTRCGFDWGFQADFMFGTDAKYGQSFGDQTFDNNWGEGDYYEAIPQLFAEVGYDRFKVKAGKFATNFVHEVLPAPMSFFYSHAFTCYNTPLTVSGVYGEYQLNKQLSVGAGWTAGAMTSFQNRYGDNGLLTKVNYQMSDKSTLTYNFFYQWKGGDENRNLNESLHALIFTHQLNKCWTYMIEGMYLTDEYKQLVLTGRAYGINQHLIYTINQQWSAGVRAEWHYAQSTIFDIPPVTGGNGGDLYAITLGLNWNPVSCFNLRPELRYDWTDYKNGFAPFDGFTRTSQFSGGLAAMVKF